MTATPLKVGVSKTPSATPTPTPSKHARSLSRSSSYSSQFIVASVSQVTNRLKLDRLVRLYLHVLENNLMPNVLVEMYFLLELLLVEQPVEKDLEEVNNEIYLDTVHNCVYLSSKVSKFIPKFRQLINFEIYNNFCNCLK